MFNRSKLAIWLRNTKWIYGSYLRLITILRKTDYNDLQFFLFFMGYPRSGSSTLGSMLDAHPNIIISHELNAFHFIEEQYNRKQLFYLIQKNARLFTRKGRISSGYKGLIEGQQHISTEPILVIGDKKAGMTTSILNKQPEILSKIRKTVEVPLKCIHIVRNPFDMITTQAYGGNEKSIKVTPELIQKAMDFCFNKIDIVHRYINSGELDIFTLKHEALLLNPERELRKLLIWLELEQSSAYIKACCNHLYNNPHRSRLKYNWTEKEKSKVLKKIEEVEFLRAYSFEN